MGFNSAMKVFLAWLRSEKRSRHTGAAFWFVIYDAYEILNLMRFHMEVRCVSSSWEAQCSYNMATAIFPFDSIWLAPSRGDHSLHCSPHIPLLMHLCPQFGFGPFETLRVKVVPGIFLSL